MKTESELSAFKEQIQKWHEADEHERIIAAIKALPEEELDYELIGLLGRALNNAEHYDEAIAVFLSVEEQGREDSLWNYRIGYAYFYKHHSQKEALKELQSALEYFTCAREQGEPDADTLCEWCMEEIREYKFKDQMKKGKLLLPY